MKEKTNLYRFLDHTVLIQVNNKVFRGKVSSVIGGNDNENNKNSLIIDAVGYEFPIEIYEDEIQSIEIMK